MDNQAIEDTDALDLMYASEKPEDKRPSSKDVVADENKALGYKGMAVGSMASDPTEWVRYAAQELYPDEPLAKSVQRFGVTKDGEYYHTADDGKLYKVKPESFTKNLVAGAGKSIPMGIGALTGASVSALSVNPALGVPAGFAAGYLGDQARQAVGDYFMGEASTYDPNKSYMQNYNTPEMVFEGVTGGTGEIFGKGAPFLYNMKTAPDLARMDSAITQAAYDRADKYGVPITPAQATGLRSQIAQELRLSQRPSTMDKFDQFYKTQNEKSKTAFNQFLTDNFGQQRDAGSLSTDAKRIAKNIIEERMDNRASLSQPMYDMAGRTIENVDVSPVKQIIDRGLQTAKGDVRKAYEIVQEELQRNGSETGELENAFEPLNNVKVYIDKLIEDPEFAVRKGLSGSDAQTNAVLKSLRQSIIEQIEEVDPNGLYRKARGLSQNLLQTDVEPVREALAPLMRVNPTMGTMMMKGAQAVLDPTTRTPELVRQARELFIKNGQADAWNAIVGQFIRSNAVKAMEKDQMGQMRNFAGKVAKEFSNDFVDENLKAAMHPSQYAAYKDIMELFSDLGKTYYNNTRTAFILKEFEEEAKDTGKMAKFIGAFEPLQYAKKLKKFFGDRFQENKAQMLADLFTKNDRKVINQLRALKTYTKGDTAIFSALAQILARGGYLIDDAAREGKDLYNSAFNPSTEPTKN